MINHGEGSSSTTHQLLGIGLGGLLGRMLYLWISICEGFLILWNKPIPKKDKFMHWGLGGPDIRIFFFGSNWPLTFLLAYLNFSGFYPDYREPAWKKKRILFKSFIEIKDRWSHLSHHLPHSCLRQWILKTKTGFALLTHLPVNGLNHPSYDRFVPCKNKGNMPNGWDSSSVSFPKATFQVHQ